MGKNIYLFGISGVYNYGCEAMVRGISGKIKQIYPESNVIYKTRNLDKDKIALKSCEEVSIEPIVSKTHSLLKKALRFAKRELSIASPQDYISIDWKWTRDCDLLIIIGGDVFDLTAAQKTQKRYRNERIYISKLVKKAGGKVVLWGISVGDFDVHEHAKKTLIDFFKNTVDLAIIRDKDSYDYLRRNGVDNIKLCSDPAFMMRAEQTEITGQGKKILGINLSPLANRYLGIDKTEDEWIAVWADAVKKIYDASGYDEIYLIPHVVNQDCPSDDDFAYLSKLEKVLIKHCIPITLVPGDIGFLGIKKYLTDCNLLMAARMHCAVNAVTCGVPTVFLSYSPKSYGMCEHVYGRRDYCLDMRELVRDVDRGKIASIANHSNEMRNYLKERNVDLFNDAAKTVEYIRDLL